MAEEQNDKRLWTVEDFIRYHSGKMPEQEMYALEKASLDDPFLEDALEGYAFVKTPVAAIKELKNKLSSKKEEVKIVWYKQKGSSQILKIAAVLLLFAGFAWLLYPSKKNKQVEIASVKNTTEKYDSIITRTVADSSLTFVQTSPGAEQKESDIALNKFKTKTPGNTIINDDYKNEIAAAPARENEDTARARDFAAKKTERITLAKTKKVDAALSGRVAGVTVSPDNTVKGTVVDKDGEPVPYATIKVPSANTNTAADANGNFAFKNNENAETVKVNVNAAGFETTSAAVNTNSDDIKIVLQQTDKTLSEVVVTGYGQEKQKRSVSSSARAEQVTERNNNSALVLKNAQPVAGWQNFNRSVNELNKNIKRADSTGQVILLFDINAAGAAIDISVKKSLSISANNAAINILKNVPAIKKIKKGRKAQAVFNF